MMIRHLTRSLRARVPTWDRPTQVAFATGVILFPFMLILGFAGPEPIQIPARAGAFGLVLSLQLVFLWGNRRMLSPYHEAQQYFMNADYAAAKDVLEQIPLDDRISVDALVLLANTYRHLGQYTDSITVAERALEEKTDYHSALYGLGKTYMVIGQYADASNFITKALSMGAPDVVQFDLGHVYYLSGDYQRAVHHINNILLLIHDEPTHLLLAQYMLFQMQAGEQPSKRLIERYINHWQNEADKFKNTPYSDALKMDIDTLTTGLRE